MTNLSKLFTSLSTLYSQSQTPTLVTPSGYTFPYDKAYIGQDRVIKDLQGFSQAALTSPTGTGKTAVFMAATRGIATLVIEPRKFLQVQVQSYFQDFVLFGKSEYQCQHARNAATAPCNRRIECDSILRPDQCPKAPQNCNASDCKVFSTKEGVFKYPCKDCLYIKAQIEASRVLKRNGTVICNFGNFWQLLKDADAVVIDEADLFFREISHPMKMMYSDARDEKESIQGILMREKRGLEEAIKKSSASAQYHLQNLKYGVDFLLQHHELCFMYRRKDKIYIEVNPANVGILKDKIFKKKRLLIVSATLGDFDIPKHTYSVWQRRGIYYCPVGKLTSRNLKANPWIMAVAAERIETISSIAEGLYDTKKFPVHCGNLGTHATALNILLGPDRNQLYCPTCGEKQKDIDREPQQVKCECGAKFEIGEEMCTLHKAGSLMKTISDFTEGDSRYLLIAGADYGGDFGWAKIQYILKFPYASLDERMRVLERTMGSMEFNKYYVNDAISRFVQQCGRTCRGHGDFGATIVFDSKFLEEYQAHGDRFPAWWKEGFDGRYY